MCVRARVCVCDRATAAYFCSSIAALAWYPSPQYGSTSMALSACFSASSGLPPENSTEKLHGERGTRSDSNKMANEGIRESEDDLPAFCRQMKNSLWENLGTSGDELCLHTHIPTHERTRTRTHAHTHTHIPTHECTRTHVHTHTHTHERTHTQTHAHTYTLTRG